MNLAAGMLRPRRTRVGQLTFAVRGYIDLSLDEVDDFPTNDFSTDKLPKVKFIKNRYVSPWCHDTKKSFGAVMSYLINRKRNKLKFTDIKSSVDTIPVVDVDMTTIDKYSQEGIASFTWLGHASCYYQTNSVRFLTDPVWSDRCFPVQWLGPKRTIKPRIDIDKLPIDVVLLSHTHYDHLDEGTARSIGNRALWIVPLGVKKIVQSFGVTNCVELNWWDTYTVNTPDGRNVTIVFTPAKHWTSRSFFDRNTCLWGGFAVLSEKNKFYFAGDTAYCDVFKLIGKHLGPFDFSAIPIGAYKPRSFMKASHCDPEEAVWIHKDVQSVRSCAIHWGTFPLADEDDVEPPLELARVRQDSKVTSEDFFSMAHGETVAVTSETPHSYGKMDYALNNPKLYSKYLDYHSKFFSKINSII